MNGLQTFLTGIAPDHVPALIAALLLPLLVLAAHRLRAQLPTPPAVPAVLSAVPAGAVAAPGPWLASAGDTSEPTVSTVERTGPVFGWARGRPAPVGPRPAVRVWAAWLLGLTAVIHLALPLGHAGNGWLTAGFLGSGAAFAWLAMRAWEGRSWRLWSGLLLAGTLLAYLLVAGTGHEEPDQVGIITAMIELFALGLALRPSVHPLRRKRFKRFVSSAGVVTLTFVVGAWIWGGSVAAHATAGAASSTATPAGAADGIDHSGHDHSGHDSAARAQAGIIMRPSTEDHPTVAETLAADALARSVRTAMARYARLDAALADGYVLPRPATGPAVHLDNKAFEADGRVLDPNRPEKLVYAIDAGRATLLGVVFVMEKAGVPGPQPGGPITRWHAHNACLTVLPPGFSIVSAFGGCPALSISVTTPEMMHVWVVDNPGGWFTDGLDEKWSLAYNTTHGQPY